ncbi:MAG TPA: LysR family transcriptional regulator [Holophagaceae bacterium]|nr:LysR family transcriptional regulator [Holophagaceae bacterium]
MELSQLEVFVTVAREGSVSRAALRLHKTQPAVSMALKRLEDSLGEPLLVRSGRGLALTHAGRSLLDYAESMLRLRSEAFDTLKGLRGLGQGTLTLVGPDSIVDCLLPDLIRDYHLAHPKIAVQLHRGYSERIPGEVLRHEYDFGFIAAEPVVEGLQTLTLQKDALVAVVAPEHPLTKLAPKNLAALAGFPLALHSPKTPMRLKLEAHFRHVGIEPRIAFDLDSFDALKAFAAEGLAVGLLPELTVARELAQGTLKRIPVPGLRIERSIRMVHRGDVILSRAAHAFLELVRTRVDPSRPGDAPIKRS